MLVHKFVCRGTVEDKIDQMIESKQQLAGDFLSGGADMLLTEMKDEELLKLVALDLGAAMKEGDAMSFYSWRLCAGGREAAAGTTKARQAQEAGTICCTRDDRGPEDRQEFLGPVVVHQPRTVQRL